MKPRLVQFGRDAQLGREKMREACRKGVEAPHLKPRKVAAETNCLTDGDSAWEDEVDWAKVTIDYLHLQHGRQTKGAYT